MTNRLQPPVPAGVLRVMRQHEKIMERENQRRAVKLSRLLAAGKTEEAIEFMAEQRSPIPERAEKLIATMPEEKPRRTSREAAEVAVRQRKIVDILTSGSRCSLNRAWKLAGYGNHRESLDQLLSSPTIMTQFKRAVDDGRPLPRKYRARIEQALEDRELGIR